MELRKLTGPQAGSLKYDLLTALSVAGLQGSPTLQSSMLRLCAMITARYNWRLDEISIGQAELARIWGVNERTVKREMKRLTGQGGQQGWLVCLRPGVRGRVGAYRLDYPKIYDQTRTYWPVVGPDFAERMEQMSGGRTVVKVDFTAPVPGPAPQLQSAADLPQSTGPQSAGWDAVSRRLHMSHPELHQSWFGKLTAQPAPEGHLRLQAPNPFVAGYVKTHLLRKLEEAVEISAKSAGVAPPVLTISSKS